MSGRLERVAVAAGLPMTFLARPQASWRSEAGPGALEAARERLDRLLAAAAVDARAVYACELVLEEWLTNVWRHGFRGAPGAAVDVVASVDDTGVCLCFTDAAAGFDPLTTTPPARPAALAEARPGGLGLQMIRQWASDCRYRRVDDHNELTVRIARR